MAAMVRDGDALLLQVKVRPSAQRSGWRGRVGDFLKLDIAAAPEKGRANAELLAFVAQSFGVKPADVELCVGAHGRQKQLRIRGPWRLPAELADETVS